MNLKSNDSIVRIGISGSYGGFNLGDEAILQSIIRNIRASVRAEITVFSRNPDDTCIRHKVERVVAVRELSQTDIRPEIERLDFFLLGGGGILYDADVRTYLREPLMAIELRVPFMICAVSAGPLHDLPNQKLVKECLSKAMVVTVRDRTSRQLLENLGVRREIIVTADPALLTEPEAIDSSVLLHENMEKKGRMMVGMSVREPGVAAPDINQEHYREILANTADYLIDRFEAVVVFIPMERGQFDLQQSHAVMSSMLLPQHARVLEGDYSPGQLMSVMKQLDLAIGMRLHFLIFAALQNIPIVGLSYSPKVNSFLEGMRLPMPPLNVVNAGRIIAHVDRAWDNKESILQRMREPLPELCSLARKNFSLMLEALTKLYEKLPSPATQG